jgi:hypothetical protein
MAVMSRPTQQLIWMVAGLLAACGLVFLLWDRITTAFWHNPALNSGILAVLLIGIVFIFWQVIRLNADISWLEGFVRGGQTTSMDQPRLLAPFAAMMRERTGRVNMSATALRSVLDGVQSRLDEGHEISRYFTSLLILLGLLGTFWGLLSTISAVAAAIRDLNISGTDPAGMFNDLKAALNGPLNGMGTAFSASLFGLSGSLVLGYLDLQAGQANNRFYVDVEDWLSGMARLGGGGPLADSEQSVPAYIQALLEQTAESLENLQRTMARAEDNRLQATAGFNALAEHLVMINDQLRAQQQMGQRVADSQGDIRTVLTKLIDVAQSGGLGIDSQSRAHLRNIDTQLTHVLQEVSQGRNQSVQELRSEIKLLARTIAAVGGAPDHRA